MSLRKMIRKNSQRYFLFLTLQFQYGCSEYAGALSLYYKNKKYKLKNAEDIINIFLFYIFIYKYTYTYTYSIHISIHNYTYHPINASNCLVK